MPTAHSWVPTHTVARPMLALSSLHVFASILHLHVEARLAVALRTPKYDTDSFAYGRPTVRLLVALSTDVLTRLLTTLAHLYNLVGWLKM